jgi:hypothetical protein
MRDSKMIYLIEAGGQYVGPFKTRMHAERFIELMELCGEDWADTEVVEEDRNDSVAGRKESIH